MSKFYVSSVLGVGWFLKSPQLLRRLGLSFVSFVCYSVSTDKVIRCTHVILRLVTLYLLILYSFLFDVDKHSILVLLLFYPFFL